jgi:hypothetical protein
MIMASAQGFVRSKPLNHTSSVSDCHQQQLIGRGQEFPQNNIKSLLSYTLIHCPDTWSTCLHRSEQWLPQPQHDKRQTPHIS